MTSLLMVLRIATGLKSSSHLFSKLLVLVAGVTLNPQGCPREKKIPMCIFFCFVFCLEKTSCNCLLTRKESHRLCAIMFSLAKLWIYGRFWLSQQTNKQKEEGSQSLIKCL